MRRATTVLAGLLVLFALLLPSETNGLDPAAFLRIPVEALLGVALVLVLPVRAGRVVAALGGLLLGLLTILKIVDLGFATVLSRPFDPVVDWSLIGSGVEFLSASMGRTGAIAAVVGAGLLAGAVLLLLTLAVLRLSRVVVRHRAAAARTAAALGVVWLTCAVLGAQLVPGLPVAAANTAGAAYTHAVGVRTSLHDRDEFARQLVADPYRDIPADRLLTALRGKDVVLAVLESYGRSAVEGPEFAPAVAPLLDEGTRRLDAAGFASRSAFLTSSTSGGGSWLAHATLLSGLWIDNQQRYRDLEASDRGTLSSAFRRAGWRTVGVMPGVTSPWPEAGFYQYNRIYDAGQLGYRGPKFSWATMPDQYTLNTFQQLERSAPGRPPVMAEIPLVSSHAPWSPLPRLVAWHDVGDGQVFNSMNAPGAEPNAILTRDPARVRADYRASIEYSLNSLISYVETYGDDRLVLVFLGDHQPSPIVTGEGAGRDVPITIVTRDRALLDRISGWHWQAGLRPHPDAPVWRMDAFRDHFLTAFGPP
ncbi:hypothetical protein GCM10023321_21980 [Pseudonocardia eucalypti]|uniref:Sulfatase n=1 Tax=Pseudonocardia eucalypti TaxID=648755 RepID=A0ABP9PVB4_9PSEU|nr:hypothetical protein [Pseudonocardia eucalypti]